MGVGVEAGVAVASGVGAAGEGLGVGAAVAAAVSTGAGVSVCVGEAETAEGDSVPAPMPPPPAGLLAGNPQADNDKTTDSKTARTAILKNFKRNILPAYIKTDIQNDILPKNTTDWVNKL